MDEDADRRRARWLLLGMIAVTVALSAAAMSVGTCTSAGCGGDVTKLSLTGVVAVAATTAVLGSLLAGRLILSRHGSTAALSSTDGPTIRATAGSVVYLTLIALLSLGLAAVVRDSAAGIGVILGLLYLLPILAQVIGDPHGQRLLQRIAPMSAGLAVQATTDLHSLPLGPWTGLAVTADVRTGPWWTGSSGQPRRRRPVAGP